MNKLFTKIAGVALGLTMAIGVGVAFGSNSDVTPVHATVPSDTTITFNTNTSSSDSTSAYSTSNKIADVANGTSAFSAISDTSKVYKGKSGTGLKFGSSSAIGYIGFTLSSGYQENLKSIKVTVQKYGSDTGKVILKTGSTTNTWSSGSTQRMTIAPSSSSSTNSDTYTFSTPSMVGRIWLGTTAKRAYVTEVVLHYEESTTTTVQIDTAPKYLIDGGASDTLKATIAHDNSYTITWSASPSTGVSFSSSTSTSGSSVNVSFDGVTAGTTPIVITATLNDTDQTHSSVNVYALEHAGTAEDPFSATDAMVFSHTSYAGQSGGDWYVQGYVVGTYQTNKGYYIDEDPTATSSTKFEIYNSSGVTNQTGKEIIVGTSYVVAHGSMTYYSGTSQCEATGSVITSVDNGATPGVIIEQQSQTIDGGSTLNLSASVENPVDNYSIVWESSDEDILTVASTGELTATVTANKNPGSADVKAIMIDANQEVVAESTAITITVYVPLLSAGDYVVFYYDNSTYLSDINTGKTHYGNVADSESGAVVYTVEAGNDSETFSFVNSGNYLTWSSGNSLDYSTTKDSNSSWSITGSSLTDCTIKNSATPARMLRYNSGSPRFACYESGQNAVNIKKVEAPVVPVVESVTVIGDSTADAEGAISITKEFLYEVVYEDITGNEGITVTVLNSNDEEEGASVTKQPADGAFSVTFTASDTYTVSIKSTEDPSKTNSTTIVVSNIYVPVMTNYSLYEGTNVSGNPILTEGDYLIYYDGKIMNDTIDSDRAQYQEVTPVDSTISTDNIDVVWHITPVGDYYTIYSQSESKYLASTGAKNKIQLLADGTDDKSLWTVTISDGKFEFVNKQNAASEVNSNLRENGSYGFACYATGTGGALSLYKKAYDADGYSNILTNYLGIVCDASTGNTNITNLTNTWKILSAEYGLLSSSVKEDLVDSSKSEAVLSALSSYDYVVGKYNKAQGIADINDFMGRDPDPVGNLRIVLANSIGGNQGTITIIVIASFASLAAFGGYFLFKKKKQ